MKNHDYILFVEDDPIMIFLLQSQLRRNKPEYLKHFVTKNNGKEALEHLTASITPITRLPKLILLDLNMPIMNGWDFLEAIDQDQKLSKIPIIILTSSVDRADRERSQLYSSVIAYKTKPLSGEDLLKITSQYLA